MRLSEAHVTEQNVYEVILISKNEKYSGSVSFAPISVKPLNRIKINSNISFLFLSFLVFLAEWHSCKRNESQVFIHAGVRKAQVCVLCRSCLKECKQSNNTSTIKVYMKWCVKWQVLQLPKTFTGESTGEKINAWYFFYNWTKEKKHPLDDQLTIKYNKYLH